MEEIRALLLAWYEENGRPLPWRMTGDPYKIWISEIILQQTQVKQGMAYWHRFMARFPDVISLANADEDEVMRLWQGLGYYSRARNLHAAARMIRDEYAGHFPTTYEEVHRLKGVGDYTASAICAFAYNLPHAAVDGNAYRVLARLFGVETPIDTVAGKREFATLADALLDRRRAGDFNQAIMDLGATVCTPLTPDCGGCPLATHCEALHTSRTEVLPTKSRRTKVTDRYFNYIYVRAGKYTFLRKRGEGDIWQGLYELPLIETDTPTPTEDLLNHPVWREWMEECHAKNPTLRLVAKEVKHVLSHRIIHATCHELTLPEETPPFKGYLQVMHEQLDEYPMPRLMEILMEEKEKTL